jgi:uncharacterized protein YndB with AHSA1/START domain
MFTERTTIDAPRHAVWAALADIGTIATWNPGLTRSHRTNDIDGLGGTRHCDISTKHSLTEQVVTFEPLTAITFRITDSTLPFKTADIAFTLTESQQPARTEVTVSPTYTLSYGPIGQILDTLTVRRAYQAGMRKLLDGLNCHVESTHPNDGHDAAAAREPG